MSPANHQVKGEYYGKKEDGKDRVQKGIADSSVSLSFNLRERKHREGERDKEGMKGWRERCKGSFDGNIGEEQDDR